MLKYESGLENKTHTIILNFEIQILTQSESDD